MRVWPLRLTFLLLALLVSVPAWAQRFERTTGSITANATCVTLDVGGLGTGTIELTGTWMATVTFYVEGRNGTQNIVDANKADTPATAVNTATANGIWSLPVAGYQRMAACTTAFTSGTITVSLEAAGTGGGGGGGSGGEVTSGDAGNFLATVTLSATDNAVLDDIADGIAVTATDLDVQSGGADILSTTAFNAAFGTAGTADAQVLSVQGIASGTALTVTATNLDVQIGGSDTVAVSNAGLTELAAAINSNLVDVNIVSGAGSGGTALADDADFTAGTTSFTPSGGFYQSSVTACTDGDTCAFGITAQRTLKATLFSAAGAEITVATDWTVGSAAGTTGPGIQAIYKDRDGSALPTTANVDTEGEAVPVAASIVGVQYVMLVNEDGSLDRGSSTTPIYIQATDPCSGTAAKLYLPFDISTATTTEITPSLAGASTHYYICALNIVNGGTANNVNLVDDNTDGCGSVTASLISSGLAAGDGWNFAANGGLTIGSGLGAIMRTQTQNAVLCLVTSASSELHGQFVVVAAP